MENHHDDDQELSYFSLAEISKSTKEFSDNNKLGQGGFGPVYMVVKNIKQYVKIVNKY